MIYGKKLGTGELVNVADRLPINWDDGSTDVPLAAMPDGFGPFTYDPSHRVAVPPTAEESGKRKRKDVVASLAADDGKIVMDMLEAMYAELRKNKPRPFAELKAEVVGRFVG